MTVDMNGTFKHRLDAKGRLSLPSKLRSDLANQLVVMVSPKKECLYAFASKEAFDQWMVDVFARDGGFDASNSRHVNVRRVMKSRAIDVPIDGANRINLNPDQLADVQITKDVALIGNTGYFEIWDAQRWDDFCSDVDVDSFFA